MPSANPYAGDLGTSDPIEVLASTVASLQQALEPLSASQISTPPAPGKWNLREIAAHLADCEIAFGFRLRQCLSQDHAILQPFNQTAWGERYAAYDLPLALEVFESLRAWNRKLIASASPDDRARPATHPERGTLNFWVLVETMAGHDLHHLRQIPGIVDRLARSGPAV